MIGMTVLYCVYGIVLTVGGAIGFRKVKSVPSLVSGIIAGDLAIAAGVLMVLRHPIVGLRLGAALGAVLTIVFIARFLRTGKAMPALPLILLSLVVLALSLVSLTHGNAAQV